MFVWITEGIPSGRYPEVRRDTVEAVSNASPASSILGYSTPGRKPPISFKNHRNEYSEPEETFSQGETLHFARELMTSPVTCLRLEDSFELAKSLFIEKRFRHLPIVNSEKKIVGLISDRDFWKSEAIGLETKSIIEMGKKKVLVANPEAELHFIAQTLLEAKIGCLPVATENGAIIGIITRSDILRALVKFPGLSLRI